MSVSERASGPITGPADIVSDPTPMDAGGLVSTAPADLLAAGLTESLGRLAMLAGTALCAPRASVMFAGTYLLPGKNDGARIDGRLSSFEQGPCTDVVRSQDKLIIGDVRVDRRASGSLRPEPASMLAWAGVPVQDADDHVVGVLWVADRVARRWSASDVAVLETLAQVAWGEVSLRAALARSAGRAALAGTLEESLLPPRLPYVPGLQVAARYAASGTGTGAGDGAGAGARSSRISATCSLRRGEPGASWSATCAARVRPRPNAPRWPATLSAPGLAGGPGRACSWPT
jgi:sigma-B regulation protein RsbU (phosphoserine phosphatase)